MKKTFWALKPNCGKGLNEEDRKFLEYMKDSREGGVSSPDRVIVAKNKKNRKDFAVEKEKTQQRTKKNGSCNGIIIYYC